MKKLGLLVTVKAKIGKAAQVSQFLASAVNLARQENATLTWYAFQIDASTLAYLTLLRLRRVGMLTSPAKLPKP